MAADMQAGFSGESCISLHRVMVHDRGGVRRINQLVDVSSVTYSRELDQITGATIVVSGMSCIGQASILEGIIADRHEVVIFRGSERVWEGPILEVRWFSNRAEIIAHDVVEYLDRNPLSIDWPNEDGGGQRYMTERIRDILLHELTTPYEMEMTVSGVSELVEVPRWENLDPPANLIPHLDIRASVGPQGILTRSSTLAFEMQIGEHLRNLAEGGLDFTAVGRRLLIWDAAQSIGRTRILTEADFYGELQVIAAGSEHASIAHVSAQRDEEEEGDGPVPPSVGNAGGPSEDYGVWTRLVSLSSEEGNDTPTQLELNSQARRQLVGRDPVPLEILIPSGGGLRLSHDLRLQHLIPGVIMPVRAVMNLRRVAQDQRLQKVTVTETATSETIQVDLSAVGVLREVA